MDKEYEDNKASVTEYPVTIELLRPGVFIKITGIGWMDHPFIMNSFKIANEGQIKVLRQLGLKSVVFVPGKSDVFPLPERKGNAMPAPQTKIEDPETERLFQMKKQRIEHQRVHRRKIKACEKKFSASVQTVKNVMRNIEGGRLESVKDADMLLQNLIEDLLVEKDTAVQLMNTDAGGESVFYHSLNVSVLALMLGREQGLEKDDLRILGLGALFHDSGKHRVPKNVLFKTTPLTKFEMDILRLHPLYGVETMKPLVEKGLFPSDALWIIQDHHERIDGSGYPAGRTGKTLSDATKIVSIVNRYDNLCNNVNAEKSLTPHEALAYMFAKEQDKYDKNLLQRFISYLGVYPPGTIVRLNNEVLGLVVSVNPNNSLRPSLLIYDPEIPKTEALIFDLAEDTTLSITATMRPSQLPREVYDYLSPRARVTYFLASQDDQQSGSSANSPQRKPK